MIKGDVTKNSGKEIRNETGRYEIEIGRSGNETRRSGNETGKSGNETGRSENETEEGVSNKSTLTFIYHGFYCECVPWFHHTNCLVLWKSKVQTVTFHSLKKERRDVYFVCTYWHSVGHLAPGEITCTGEILLLDLL